MRPLPDTSARASAVVGLDIGSTTVTAAEVGRTRQGLTARHFAQEDLPAGAVVDGRIIDRAAVAEALRRLWARGGFGTRRVVLALSGPRVIIRQVEVLAMSEADFRSALRFQAADLIPIPVDDAILDFVILPAEAGEPERAHRMQVLVAAAPRAAVEGHLVALQDASLRPVAVEPAAMAAVRASLATAAGTGPVALVDVRADLTVITVRQNGQVRFSRVLDSGGDGLAGRLVGRDANGGGYDDPAGRNGETTRNGSATLLGLDLDPLATEIESSLSFFAGQLGGRALGTVLVTGGPLLAAGLAPMISRRQAVAVEALDALSGLVDAGAGLDPDIRRLASTSGLAAVGAATWTFDDPSRRLSLMPREAAVAAAHRRRWVAVAAGAGILALGLGALGLQHSHRGAAAESDARVAQAANARIAGQVAALESVPQVSSAAQARLTTLRRDASGDVAWGQLLQIISAAMPPGTLLTSLGFTGPAGGSTSGAGPLGSVTMSVTGQGGEGQVAAWLRAFSAVPAIRDMSVPSASVVGSTVTFTATAALTAAAPTVAPSTAAGGRS